MWLGAPSSVPIRVPFPFQRSACGESGAPARFCCLAPARPFVLVTVWPSPTREPLGDSKPARAPRPALFCPELLSIPGVTSSWHSLHTVTDDSQCLPCCVSNLILSSDLIYSVIYCRSTSSSFKRICTACSRFSHSAVRRANFSLSRVCSRSTTSMFFTLSR